MRTSVSNIGGIPTGKKVPKKGRPIARRLASRGSVDIGRC